MEPILGPAATPIGRLTATNFWMHPLFAEVRGYLSIRVKTKTARNVGSEILLTRHRQFLPIAAGEKQRWYNEQSTNEVLNLAVLQGQLRDQAEDAAAAWGCKLRHHNRPPECVAAILLEAGGSISCIRQLQVCTPRHNTDKIQFIHLSAEKLSWLHWTNNFTAATQSREAVGSAAANSHHP